MIELERSAAAHWRGTDEEWLGQWLLRAADGFTGRANSALPLGDPRLPLDEALAYVTGWYRARGLPAMIAVPMPLPGPAPESAEEPSPAPASPSEPSPASAPPSEPSPPEPSSPEPSPTAASAAGPAAAGSVTATSASRPGSAGAEPDRGLDAELAARGWASRPGPAYVMMADLPLALAGAAAPDGGPTLPAGAEVIATAEPDAAWLARYHYRGADSQPPVMRDVLTSAQQQAFVSIRDGSGVLAIARLSIADGWAGLTAVEVDASRRRAGLGTAITAAACGEAARRGARRVFLQVEVGNAAARALYERCRFGYSHWYRYRVAPA